MHTLNGPGFGKSRQVLAWLEKLPAAAVGTLHRELFGSSSSSRLALLQVQQDWDVSALDKST